MKVFDLFVSKYPPGNDLRKPTAETLEQFQGKVPAELLNFWLKYFFQICRALLLEGACLIYRWQCRSICLFCHAGMK